MKTSVKKNLYYEIKDKVFEERVNGTALIKQSAKYKVYGLDSTRDVRARLIEILYERVENHKDKFIATILHSEMEAMEVKKNGKVEHSNQSHDDQVFSYLMALYVWYDGLNLMERYNIQKNSLTTDSLMEEAITSLEDLDSGGRELIDLTEELVEEGSPVLRDQLEMLERQKRIKICDNINQIQDDDDARALQQILSTDEGRRLYNKSRNFDPDAVTIDGINGITQQGLPNSVFDNFNSDIDEVQGYNVYQGNLGDLFSQL